MPAHVSLLDELLPRFFDAFEGEFVHLVDGGAGVGSTSKFYWEAASRLLPSAAKPLISVYSYEPLAENARVLRNMFAGNRQVIIRESALSDRTGTQTFSVPSRMTGEGGGAWSAGTSFGGSLRPGRSGTETVQVQSVRLDEEEVPRFDFVKLDLQGGELDALRGMGSRLREPKVMYVETQLLHDSGVLRHIAEAEFFVTFDRLQLGFKNDLRYLPMRALDEAGVVIDKMHLPSQGGVPLFCWGHFRPGAKVFDPKSFVLEPEISRKLQDAGVSYLQTDALCINLRHWKTIAPLLLLAAV